MKRCYSLQKKVERVANFLDIFPIIYSIKFTLKAVQHNVRLGSSCKEMKASSMNNGTAYKRIVFGASNAKPTSE